jgi:tetratricopeptide (TPR) repeat protein
LREAGCLDEADALADAAMAHFRSEPRLAVEHVWIACTRLDWPEALRRCQRLRDNFPNHAAGFALNIMVLRGMSRTADAEALAIAGLSRFPDEAGIWVEHALLPVHRSDWPEAIQRLDELRRRFPHSTEGYRYGAFALRESAQFEEADRIIETGIRRCAPTPELLIEHGMNAMARGDFTSAVERWASLRDAFPFELQGYLHGAAALRETDQIDAAETLLHAAMIRFPDRPELAAEHAHIAAKKRDWSEALRRWALVSERFPNWPGIQENVYQLKLDSIDDAASATTVQTKIRGYHADDRDLLFSFEGLGDNCEFGAVQRHFGAEPIGLLRWAGISPADLIRALGNRFEGFGDPATTDFWITEPGPNYAGGDYLICDVEHGFHMHSFVSARDVQRDKFIQQTCRRMRFLRDKLLSDLGTGDKIFVYKRRDETRLTDEEIAGLHAGVRAYGPSTLLCVQLEDASHPNGLVEQVAEGLLVGYIDRLIASADESKIAFDSWLCLCRAARVLAPAGVGDTP